MYNEKNVMRHNEDELLVSINSLQDYCSEDNEKMKDLLVIIEYIDDIVGLCGYFKDEAEKNAEFVNKIVSVIAQASLESQKDAKRRYIKDFMKIMKASKNKE